jgi:hypothetical protein
MLKKQLRNVSVTQRACAGAGFCVHDQEKRKANAKKCVLDTEEKFYYFSLRLMFEALFAINI